MQTLVAVHTKQLVENLVGSTKVSSEVVNSVVMMGKWEVFN